jgi:alpha-tubulin suppressor-like RCC1 family protein
MCVDTETCAANVWPPAAWRLRDQRHTNTRTIPEAVTNLDDEQIVQVAAGAEHSLALTADGDVYAWGANSYGQLGRGGADWDDHSTPQPITGLAGIEHIVASGSGYSFAIDGEDVVYAWGLNDIGQLGLGYASTDSTSWGVLTPTEVEALGGLGLVQLAVGGRHNVALTDAGVYTWGQNWRGELGLGTISEGELTPQRITALEYVSIVELAVGYNHNLALTDDGALYSWGGNWVGQLGREASDPEADFDPTPGLVGLGEVDVAALAARGNHSLALTSAGSMLAWGANWKGQLGLGTTIDQPTPAAIESPTGVTAVFAGRDHSFAIVAGATSGNQAPTADDVTVVVPPNRPSRIPLADYVNDPDGDPLTASIVTAAEHGTCEIVAGTLDLIYTPEKGFKGTDTCAYRVSDGELTSQPATVTIHVGVKAAAEEPGRPDPPPRPGKPPRR